MIEQLKKRLYFFIAWYFRLFAQIKLLRWNPRIIVITGSSGKTTLMHFVHSQLKSAAKCSHHSNSALGIPFDILGLRRSTLKFSEWPALFFFAPLKAFSSIPLEKLYVVECDCDRPGEGKFLSHFLKPAVTLWVSVSRTHSENFDHLVEEKKFNTVEEAISYEYGYFARNTSKLVIINGDSSLMKKEIASVAADIIEIAEKEYLQQHILTSSGTEFVIKNQKYHFPSLQPKEIFYAIAMSIELARYLSLPIDPTFSSLELPPGRSFVYKGVKNTTIVDSSYNANLASMIVILKMFEALPSLSKWVVLGDMKELGKESQEEHERLAEILATIPLDKIILLGPHITKYTYPRLKELLRQSDDVLSFSSHPEVKSYLHDNIKGGETILFKASQSLVFEGLIQPLLADSEDKKSLPRREIFWDGYRKERGV